MRLSVLVGNPTARSRTRVVAEAVAARVATVTGATGIETVDLADHAAVLFDPQDAEVSALLDRIATSELLVVASPTYKASYTGLLKSFLDRYGADGLAGVTAVPVMTGGSADHRLAVDTVLRSLLVELGASVPTRGLYVEMPDYDRLDEVVDAWSAAWLAPGGLLGAGKAVRG